MEKVEGACGSPAGGKAAWLQSASSENLLAGSRHELRTHGGLVNGY